MHCKQSNCLLEIEELNYHKKYNVKTFQCGAIQRFISLMKKLISFNGLSKFLFFKLIRIRFFSARKIFMQNSNHSAIESKTDKITFFPFWIRTSFQFQYSITVTIKQMFRKTHLHLTILIKQKETTKIIQYTCEKLISKTFCFKTKKQLASSENNK